jgi:3-oxoacyl-[acyl-carrier protein] reductase
MSLNGKIAVITGAASGIGAATAKMMAREGATLCLLSNTAADETALVRDAILKAGGTSEGYYCDVRDRPSVDSAVAQVTKDWGRIDVLVNCAGVFLPNPILLAASSAVDATFDVNLKGTYNMVHAVLPIMKQGGGGSIVNIASAAARLGVPGTSAYTASKAAIVALTRAVAGELKGLGIRVNAVAPGAVRTPMVAAVHTPTTAEARQLYEFLDSSTPSPWNTPFLEPEDVASVILFLASDGARGVHGATLIVDQGLTAVSQSPH